MKPKALLFDVFGTVVDWRSGIARDLAIHFQTHPSNTDPESVADAWRANINRPWNRCDLVVAVTST